MFCETGNGLGGQHNVIRRPVPYLKRAEEDSVPRFLVGQSLRADHLLANIQHYTTYSATLKMEMLRRGSYTITCGQGTPSFGPSP